MLKTIIRSTYYMNERTWTPRANAESYVRSDWNTCTKCTECKG